MSSTLDIMASAVEQRPHSFQFIRKVTGLTMTDEQFKLMAKKNPDRFKLVRFLKRDDEGRRSAPAFPASGSGKADHSRTRMTTDSIAAWPDFRNGRGIGWAWPFSSIVRQRKVYSPAGRPGSTAAQWAL